MYDNPRRLNYSFCGLDLHTADLTRVIKNPKKGSKGKVASILINSTTTFAGGTTKPKVKIGDGTTANLYADVDGGALAAGSALMAKEYADGIKSKNPAGYVLTATDGDLTVTFAAATGAGAAGAGDVHIEVEWI